MVKCNNCGAEVTNSDFCFNCGEKVEKYEPRVLVKSVEIIIEGSSLKAKILIERNPDYEETASSETDSEEDDLYYDDIDYDAYESEVFD